MTKAIKKLLVKYKEIPVAVKASIWFVVCSVLQRGISFITVPIFTRLMTTSQYGVYSTYVSWYTILIVFTSLNLYYGVFNNAMINFENQRDRYISSMQGLVTVITGIFFIVYLLFREFFNNFLGMTTPLVLLLFIELLVTPALQFWTVHNRFAYKYKSIVAVTLFKSIINPILGIIFVLLSEEKDVARIATIVLVEVIVCGFVAIYQFFKGKCFYDLKFWKYALVFNIPLIPHYLSGTILNQGDRVMISQMVGNTEVAFYSVANNIGQLMNIVTSAIASSFTPWVYQKLKEKDVSEIPRVTNLLLLLMAALVSILMFLAPELMAIIAAPEYAEAVYVIPPIAASVFFVFTYNIFSNVEFFYGVRRYVTIGSISAACANLVLNWIFISLYGYYAAGYTTLFCYIIYGLSHLWFSKKVLKENNIPTGAFDSRVVLGLSAIVIALVVLQNFLYPHRVIKNILILIVLLVMMWKRKFIISEFKKLRSKKA